VFNKQIVAKLEINNEEIKGVREEIKGSREDTNRVHESIQDVSQEITTSCEIIAGKIDDARKEMQVRLKSFILI
jgi:hypothetical protein